MRWSYSILGLALLGFVLLSCAPSGPSTIEILDSLETKVNEKDMEGVMALFAKDAVVEETYRPEPRVFNGTEGIEFLWSHYFLSTSTSEFRDISVDGETATFTWAEVGPAYTKLWPTIIEVRNGKITYMDYYEDAVRVPAGEE
jgi:ketosteroid isomerase-like protein